MIFNARQEFHRYEKNPQNKKRVDIRRNIDGLLIRRMYDYATDVNYIKACIYEYLPKDGYAVSVFKVGSKVEL